MPFRFERDDARLRIRVTLTDPLTDDEIIGVIDRQRAEGAWAYGMLVDTRGLNVPPSRALARAAVAHVTEVSTAEGRRGPVAVVALRGMVGLSEAYAFESHQHGREVQVFWSPDDANQWLDERPLPKREV
jgi:hypothetical protein